MKPLENITVLDFSQFLSAPSAALKLADLGANVIKIERPDTGDICRTLYISNCVIDGDSSLFHAINRNKDGITIDLKDDSSKDLLHDLIKKADVMILNFRPGVAKHLGIDFDSVCKINPEIVYGDIWPLERSAWSRSVSSIFVWTCMVKWKCQSTSYAFWFIHC